MNATIKQLTLLSIQDFILSTFGMSVPEKKVTYLAPDSALLHEVLKKIAGKNIQLIWTLKDGRTITAKIPHALSLQRFIIEERSLLTSKRTLLYLDEVMSVVQIC